MVKIYTPRRLRERNRWLRSDGKPNFKSRVHEAPGRLDPLIVRETPTASETTPVLSICEDMHRSGRRMVPILSPKREVAGVLTGMDIIDFLGGGKRHEVLIKRGEHSLFKALEVRASEIMTKDPVVVDSDMKLAEVLEEMIKYGVGAVPVVKKGVFEGLLTESEIMRVLAGKPIGVKVRDVMTYEVITISPESTLEDLMKLMVGTGIRRVPVVKGEELVGVISWRDIIKLVGGHEVFKVVKSGTVDELKSIPVSTIVREKFLTVTEGIDIGEAAEMMKEWGVGHALVVEDGRLKGILTERDIIYGIVVGGG
ncbi:MAG: CBS domain-containing protein [Desulfurococcales archaeon]|nr:CBS domain-containing protein [Desulfurococcales archaeon]